MEFSYSEVLYSDKCHLFGMFPSYFDVFLSTKPISNDPPTVMSKFGDLGFGLSWLLLLSGSQTDILIQLGG